MVEARFKRDGVRNTLTVTGHATGSEATCAAVSCLVQTLETALDYLDPIEYDKRVESGNVSLYASGLDVGGAYEVTRLCFLRLAAADPERVRVIREENAP